MTTRSIAKKISASLLTLSMLAVVPVMAQTTSGGSAGDGDKPINPANKTKSTGIDATKDINGNPTDKTIQKPKAKKSKAAASSASSM